MRTSGAEEGEEGEDILSQHSFAFSARLWARSMSLAAAFFDCSTNCLIRLTCPVDPAVSWGAEIFFRFSSVAARS